MVTVSQGVAVAVGSWALLVPLAAPADAAVHGFANCTALNRTFPHGVGLLTAHDHTSGDPVRNFAKKPRWYRANSRTPHDLDRDNDGIACEKL